MSTKEGARATRANSTRSVRSYQREIKTLREWLTDVQWVQPMYNGSPSCSGCGEQQHQHDAAKCGLSRLLTSRQRAASRAPGAPPEALP